MASLTESQRACVAFRGRALMVVASPGSGKTHTMTHAVASAIEGGCPPHNCLVVTFTRMAAAEMRRRLEAMGITGLTIGTFHSVCYTLIRDAWKELGFASKDIHIIDRHEQEELIKETILRSRHSPSKTAVLRCLDEMSRLADWPPNTPLPVKAVVTAYLTALKQANAVDYPMVPYLGVKIAKEKGPGWTHVFADECQDLDFAQWELFRFCDCERLFAVGDPDQLLYSWRGADADLMRRKTREWGAEIVILEENFRSGRAIVAAANKLIAHNTIRIEKSIVPTVEDDGEVTVFPEDALHERVERLMEKGGTIAVLARTHQALGEAGARIADLSPTVIGTKAKLLERDDIKDVIAILAFPDMPFASKVAERIWRRHKWSDIRVERTRAYARTNGESYLATTAREIVGLGELYGDFDGAGMIERLQWAIAYVKGATGTISAEEGGALASMVTSFVRRSTWAERTGANLIAWLNTRDAQEEISTDATLQMMTIHASKGLEFDHVVVVGVDDWVLPLKKAHDDLGAMEEERRLMFVAMTRARKTLGLAVPMKGQSRFLKEAGIDATQDTAD